ncbi:MAG: Ig-like domain-containing protein [Spirochaetales bacterium]|nr:Ig-like domain-containing protein [Spirochaetales bacterium]
MERMKNRVVRGILILLPLMLFACRDPNLLLDKLEDEVLAANDLYLKVLSITPEANDTNFNPGSEILITFDRAIDVNTFKKYFELVDDDGTSFEAEEAENELSFKFNSNTNVLTISVYPFLEGLEDYKLLLKDGLTGKDGSRIREALSLYFHTSDAPRGSIEIEEDFKGPLQADPLDVAVTVRKLSANYYKVANSLEALEAAPWVYDLNEEITIDPVEIQGDDGENLIYARFRNYELGEETLSYIKSDTVYYDTSPPVVTVSSYGSTLYTTDTGAAKSISGTADDGEGSGVDSFQWSYTTSIPAKTITFGDDESASTTVTANGENNLWTLKLVATDNVGNTSVADTAKSMRSFICDTIPPDPPEFYITEGSSADDSTEIIKFQTSDITPYIAATPGDGGEELFRYRIDGGKDTEFKGTRPYQIPNKELYSEGLPYGDHAVEVECRDAAGNWSDPTELKETLVVFPDKSILLSPPDRGTLGTGDLVWYSSKPGTHYYKIALGTSSKGLTEEESYRVRPFADNEELGLKAGTYYWKVNVYTYSFLTYTYSHSLPSSGSSSFRVTE